MNSFPDAVDMAAEAVNEDAFTRTADGTLIAQTSSRAIITTMIRELDVHPGDRILEIGTGSAYSTALLAHLTGSSGQVISLDVVSELTERAGLLLAANGYPHAQALTTDGAAGAPDYGPYERIIAWTTPDAIPGAWIAQAADVARIVTPVNITGLSKTYAVVTVEIAEGVPTPMPYLTRGAFVEMSEQIATQWLVPPHGIDALHHDAEGHPWWVSALWLHTATDEAGTQLVRRLLRGTRTTGDLLAEHEDPAGFYSWLLAANPEGLTTACLGSPAWQIGHSQPGSAAFIPLANNGPIRTVGGSSSTGAMTAWADAWRAAGSPGWERLRPTITRAAADWTVRATQPDH
jgi:protein-L-isoaspartate(D-aspartate) O-methyltransferase